MSINIYQGLPGAGKSYRLATRSAKILYKNKSVFEKTGKRRILYSNLKFTETFEQEFAGFIEYWTDIEQLVRLRNCDVLIDEVGVYFDARLWVDLPQEVRRWLQQHRKFGCDILGTAQDFSQIDRSFRLLTSGLLDMTKLIGSRDISSTRPPPKVIWGVVATWRLDPKKFDQDKGKFSKAGIPGFMWIDRRGVEIFDTTAEVAFSKDVPLRHIDKRCLKCGLTKAVHV